MYHSLGREEKIYVNPGTSDADTQTQAWLGMSTKPQRGTAWSGWFTDGQNLFCIVGVLATRPSGQSERTGF